MKKPILSSIFFIPFWLFSQESMIIKHSCNFASADTEGELYTYSASKEAIEIVENVMKANVLPQNFIIKSADCSNALAATQGKQRYILYSTSFLESFKKDAQTKWAAYCVLAHEIGHHLSNHDLEETNPSVRKRFELEADRFAGGVLYNLGANIEEAQAGINTFSKESASNTHPPKRSRLEAIAVGWKQAEEQKDKIETTPSIEVASDEKAMFQRALKEKDAEQAILILDSLIELNGNYTEAYLERGKRQKDKEEVRRNFNYAIEDFDVYLKTRQKDPVAYFERGYAYFTLGKSKEAIADFDRSLRFNAKNADTYAYRAMAKKELQQFEGASKDFEEALKITPNDAEIYYQRGLMRKYESGEPKLALFDFEKAFQLEPKNFNAISHKASLLADLKEYNAALIELDKYEKLFPKEFDEYVRRAECKIALKKYDEAIEDCNKLIAQSPKDEKAHLTRAVAKIILGKKQDVEKDILGILNENSRYHGETYLKLGCLLVQYNMPKDALEWLQKAVDNGYEPERIAACRADALKLMKK